MVLWSSRSRLNPERGKRCPIIIAKKNDSYECLRPAKTYAQTLTKGKELFDLGSITCCKSHAKLIEAQGVKLRAI